MGRPTGGKGGKGASRFPAPKAKKGRAQPADEDLGLSGSDSEDLDAFKSRKDRVNLNVGDDSEDEGSSDLDNEAAVYDLDDPSDEDDDDGDDNDDEAIEDALDQGGNIAQRECGLRKARE